MKEMRETRTRIAGKSFPVTNPTNGQVLAHVPDMDGGDVRRAVEAAHTVRFCEASQFARSSQNFHSSHSIIQDRVRKCDSAELFDPH